jgi:ABC-type branched-subunit amino acid transport system ATPase component
VVPEPDADAPPALVAEGLRKAYGGVVAVGGVGLEVRRGEMVALIGRTARARAPCSTC